jgi:glycosyltransferase involved in cell wall biosynthesis
MKLCTISFKECWQEDDGRWFSYGGFPLQMGAVGSLFDEVTMLVCRGKRRPGGLPLPDSAHVIPMRMPKGVDTRRKISLVARLPYYLGLMAKHVRRADAVHVPVPGDLALLGMWVTLAMRKPLLARYGGSWHATNSRTTAMNQVTKACMRRFAGGRNVMLATGDGQDPPADRMQWIFSTALSNDQVASIDVPLDRGLSEPPRLVYIGRLSIEKGVIHLLEALKNLRTRDTSPMPRLTIIGDGAERNRLTQFVNECGCSEFVEFTGQVPHGGLTPYLSRADICVQPSLTEGFSKAWLDAMVHGLPVMASDVGAAADVIGRNGERGWILPPGDSQRLAEQLQRVLNDPIDWPQIRRRCHDYVASRTLERWAQRIAQICADHWDVTCIDGKLRKTTPRGDLSKTLPSPACSRSDGS